MLYLISKSEDNYKAEMMEIEQRLKRELRQMATCYRTHDYIKH